MRIFSFRTPIFTAPYGRTVRCENEQEKKFPCFKLTPTFSTSNFTSTSSNHTSTWQLNYCS